MTVRPESLPLFSIVTPVYDPPVDVLAETIQSAIDQTFEAWELILVDDCSPNPRVRETIRQFVARDPRVRLIEREVNGHIVAASNDGIAAARGTFIALLDHDDLLTPDALETVSAVIERFDDVDYVYSDEDKIDAKGRHYEAFAKPDWSPERLRAQNYCCHFSVLRTSLVREVGGFREGYDGSQDHDIILRVSERARRVHHISQILYHWRVVPGSAAGDPTAKPYAVEAGRRAVQDQLQRLGLPGRVELGPGRGHYRTHHELSPQQAVSVVIAGDDSTALVWGEYRELLQRAVESACAHTSHERVEFVIVHDGQLDKSRLDQLAGIAGARVRFVRCAATSRKSERHNAGALAATGDRLVFLDQATEVGTLGWLENLIGPLEESSAGLTGPKILRSDSLVSSCGLARHERGYRNVGRGAGHDQPGDFGTLWSNREVTALGAACLAIRREDFLEVGGFCQTIDDALVHLDLAFKVRRAGMRVIAVPGCEVFHFAPHLTLLRGETPGFAALEARWETRPDDQYARTHQAFSKMLTPNPRRLVDAALRSSRLS